MNNKKGLSTVVTTLIIILLVFIAIGIIWIVIRNVLEGGVTEIDYANKCLAVSIQVTNRACSGVAGNQSCNITISRGAGGDPISGVKVVYSDGVTNNVTDAGATFALIPLQTKTTTNIIVGGVAGTVTSASVTPYFKDAQGVEHLCQ